MDQRKEKTVLAGTRPVQTLERQRNIQDSATSPSLAWQSESLPATARSR